ncbi:hypothetical protein AYO50_02305 [Acidobacteria bacterium SCGC AG-212-P17]|nr:hypothetical protein AYO50_02305 [Acidobacteria bacterium SCGC AG-212-P17]
MTASLSELSKLSEQLNKDSERVNTIITTVNQSLASMNLGVECWLPRFLSTGEHFISFGTTIVGRSEDRAIQFGYARAENAFQLAIRNVMVQECTTADGSFESRIANPGDPHPLLKANRTLRIDALELLGELTEAMKSRVASMIASIQKGTEASSQLVIEDLVEKRSLDSSVEDLALYVRTYNCLKNANIQTVRDLVQKTEAQLLKTKNFGRWSLNEIRELLASMDFSLGMKIDEHGEAVKPEADPS